MDKYKTYYTKIRKAAKIKQKLYRFRFLIISLIVVFVASISGFLFTKGMIINNVQVKDNFNYGDDIILSQPKALFSNTSYQFKQQDTEDWSEEKPTQPGKYSVRVAAKGAFGTRFSAPQEFNISPRELTYELNNKEIVYGENPKLQFNLVDNDKIILDYSYQDYCLKETTVTITVKDIINNQGNSVIDLYEVPTITEKITFKEKNITLKPNINLDNVYDGNEVERQTIDYGLAYNDQVNFDLKYYKYEGDNLVSIDYIPKEVGRYECKIDDTTLEINNGKDSTLKNYKINNSSFGRYKFNINKRDIDVITGSKRKVYDGSAIINDSIEDCKISATSPNQLVNGHKIVFNKSNNSTYINAGTYDNRLEINVLDSEDNDVTENYNLNYLYGKLIIEKYHIDIKPYEYKGHVYNGLSFNLNDYLKNNNIISNINDIELPNGEYINYYLSIYNENGDLVYNIKDAGKYTVKFNGFDFANSYFNENNYDIVIVGDSTFEIKKKDLSIKPSIYDDFKYNGNENYEIIKNQLKSDGLTYLNETSLIEGDKIDFDICFTDLDGNVLNSIKNVGTYKVVIDKVYGLYSTNINNYNINKDTETTFEITKRNLNITSDITNIDNKQYGDNIITNKFDAIIDSNSEDNLVESHNIKVNVKFDESDLTGKNIGLHTVSIVDAIISDIEGNDVSNNYVCNYNDATYQINKRDVIIEPTYDDLHYTYGDFERTNKLTNTLYFNEKAYTNKLKDENIVLKVDYTNENDEKFNTLKLAGLYKINYLDFDIIGGNKENYNITFKESTIQIAKRHLDFDYTLTNKIYDGKEVVLEYNKNVFLSESTPLADGDTLFIEYTSYKDNILTKAINAGKYTFNALTINLTNIDSYDLGFSLDDVVYQYEINKKEVKLEITTSKDKYIYGEDVDYNVAFINNESFLENHVVEYYYTFNGGEFNNGDIGEYIIDIDPSLLVIKDENNNIIDLNNYNVITYEKKINVVPLNIKVKIDDTLTSTYDGEEHQLDGDKFTIVEGSLAYNDKLTLTYRYNKELSCVNAGNYIVKIDNDNNILLHGGKLGTSSNGNNYIVDFDTKYEYVIEKCVVDFVPVDNVTLTYNGKEQTYFDEGNSDVIITPLGDQFKFDLNYYDVNKPKTKTNMINAGNYISKLKSITPINGGLVSNYDWSKLNAFEGSVIVNKKDIYIDLSKVENKYYDGQYIEKPYITIDGLFDEYYENNIRFKYSTDVQFTNNIVPKDSNTYYYTVDLDSIQLVNKTKLEQNYNVNFINEINYGTFVIYKQKVDLYFNDNEINFFGFTFDEIISKLYNNFQNTNIKKDAISFDVSFTNKKNDEVVDLNSIALPGIYEVYITNIVVNNRDYKKNYDFNYTTEEINLTINKGNIKVKPSIKGDKVLNTEIIKQITYGDNIFTKKDIKFYPDLSNLSNVTFDVVDFYFEDENFKHHDQIKNAGSYTIKAKYSAKINGVEYADYFNFEDKAIIKVDKCNYPFNQNDDFVKKSISFDGKSHIFNGEEYVLGKEVVTRKGKFDDVFDFTLVPYKDGIEISKEEVVHVGFYDFKILPGSFGNKVDLDNYEFSKEEIEKKLVKILEITPRKVIIKPIDNKTIYNNEIFDYKIENGNFEYGTTALENQLIEGHDIIINKVSYKRKGNLIDPKDFGDYDISVLKDDVSILNYEYPDDYEIVTKDGKLFIDKKKITIKLPIGEEFNFLNGFVYDGQEHRIPINNYIDVNGDLIPGDDLKLQFNFKPKKGVVKESVKNAGTYQIILGDYNKNYSINYDDQTLVVEKANINISFKDGTVFYNDDKVDITQFIDSIEGLYPGDDIYNLISYQQADGTIDLKDAGVYNYIIKDGESNYNINILSKTTMTVLPIKYDITLSDIFKEYDGISLNELNKDLLLQLFKGSVLENETQFDFKVYIKGNNKNVGTYELDFSEFVHKNYIFNFLNQPTLTVTPKELVLNSNHLENKSETYGDKIYFVKDKFIDKDLIFGENDVINYNFIFKDSKTGELFYRVEDLVNSGTYVVIVDQDSITFNDSITKNNYIITVNDAENDNGKIIINKKIIQYRCETKEKYYDEKSFDITMNDIKFIDPNNTFINGDKLESVIFGDLNGNKSLSIDTISTTYGIADFKLVDKFGNELERDGNGYRNYELRTSDVQDNYKIKQRHIKFRGKGFNVEYDGFTHTPDQCEIVPDLEKEGYGLLQGHSIEVKLSKEQEKKYRIGNCNEETNLYFNDFGIVIKNKDGYDVTKNYNYEPDPIEDNRNKLVIRQREVEIEVPRNDIPRKVKSINVKKEYITKGFIVDGQKAIIKIIDDPKYIGLRYYHVEVRDENDSDVTYNYKIKVKII